MRSINFQKKAVSLLPESPAVYFFKDSSDLVIYVGKAKNLRSRIQSYFLKNLEFKTNLAVKQTVKLSYILVNSEFEALLLEAAIVQDQKPKFNIQLRDDKSPIYIAISKEKYPRVMLLRKTELTKEKLSYVFGPFINAMVARKLIRYLRKIFPFSQHKQLGRLCIYSQLGLCKPCPSQIEKTKDHDQKQFLQKLYIKNIKSLVKTLKGKYVFVRHSLEKEMKKCSESNNFEAAREILHKIKSLDHLTTQAYLPNSYLENPNFLDDVRKKETLELKKILSNYFHFPKLVRIECFDVAHLAGTHPTASMVTFINGEPDKQHYRRFFLSSSKGGDFEMIREVIKRRTKHFGDWGVPDLIIVDGGKPQIKAANESLNNEISLIGLAKKNERIVLKTKDGFKEFVVRGKALNLLQRLRDESHRFARAYHHKLVSRAFKN